MSAIPDLTYRDFRNANYDRLTEAQKALGMKKFSKNLSYCTSTSTFVRIIVKDYSKACQDYLTSIGWTTPPGTVAASTAVTTTASTTAATAPSTVSTVAAAVTKAIGSATNALVTDRAAAVTVASGSPVDTASTTLGTTVATFLLNGGNATGVATGGDPRLQPSGPASLGCLQSINDCIDSQLRATTASMATGSSIATPSVGAGVVCYDAYLCTSEQTAALGHHLLGPVGLVLCLAALFAQLIFLALFRFRSVRSPTSLYLSAMCLFDIIACVMLGLLPVTHFLPRDTAVQKEVYHSFTVYLAPFGQPLLEWADLASLYLLIVLFVQHRCGLNKVKFVLPTVLCLAGALLMYSVPKTLRFWYASDAQNRRALRLTAVGADATYQKIEDQLLKVPVELFIPYLTIGGFTFFRLYKRLDKYLLNKSMGRRGSSAGGGNNANALTAATVAANDRRDRQMRKDSANEDIVSMTGGLVFLCRFPNLVFHIVRSHGPSVRTRVELIFYVVSTFLLIVSLLVKPAVYLGRGSHYRRQVRLFLASVCGGGGGGGGSGNGAAIGGSGSCVSCSRCEGLDKDPRQACPSCDSGAAGGSSGAIAVPMSVIRNYARCSTEFNSTPTQVSLLATSPQTDAAAQGQPLLDKHQEGHLPVVIDLPCGEIEEAETAFNDAGSDGRADEDEFIDALPSMDEHVPHHNQHQLLQHPQPSRQRNSVSVSSENAAFVSLEDLAS